MTGPFMPADPNEALRQYERETGINIQKDGLPYGHAIRHDNYGYPYVCGSISFQSAGAGFSHPTPVDQERWNRYDRHIVAWREYQADLGDLWVE